VYCVGLHCNRLLYVWPDYENLEVVGTVCNMFALIPPSSVRGRFRKSPADALLTVFCEYYPRKILHRRREGELQHRRRLRHGRQLLVLCSLRFSFLF